MSEVQSQTSTGKMIAVVIVVAIVAAVAATLVQRLLLGDASPALTGGLVGGLSAAVALGAMKRKSG